MVATSAVREATNGRAFVAAVERATGRRVEVVSGEEEARLVLRGVRSGLQGLAGTLVTFDIGGGSTEYILADPARNLATVSLPLGVVPLAQRFPFTHRGAWGRYAALPAEGRGRPEPGPPPANPGARLAHP